MTLLTRQQVKFDWTPLHHTAFLTLKEAIIQAPILHYPNPNKRYIIYTDASDDAFGAQLSQEHNGTEFPIAFLAHTFTETQRKWSTTKQDAYGVYYAVTKWNYYLQGADIIVQNNQKPLAKFLNRKNANNKVNLWGLELATYNVTYKWISGGKNKAADCLSTLMKQLPTTQLQSTCLQLLNWMDLPSTQEVKPDKIPHQITPLHRQILHLMFHQTQPQHQNPHSRQVGSSSSDAEN